MANGRVSGVDAAVRSARTWLTVALVVVAGLAQAEPERLVPGFVPPPRGEKVLIVPADVQLYSISGGGVTEPRADWSGVARALLRKVFEQRLRQAGFEPVELPEATLDEYGEQLGLQVAVSRSIMIHHVGADRWVLPSKQGRLDWTVGDALQPLAAASGARYGFFVHVRDSYASGERKAAAVGMALLGALTGIVVMPGMGWQSAYASLMDLQDGRVLWFNAISRGSGDLREEASGLESVNALMAGFPNAK